MAVAKRVRTVSVQPRSLVMPRAEGALATALLREVRAAGLAGIVHVTASEAKAERLAGLLWKLAPAIDTLLFPPWDCLPYDRSSPSARIMGLRVATLSGLARKPERPWIVLTTPEALVQRVPPRSVWDGAARELTAGQEIDPVELEGWLAAVGYRADEVVDEAGEYAVRGAVIDVFPAGYYLPVRIDHEEARILSIASFDAATQRTTDPFEQLKLRPVSEAVLLGDAPDEEAALRQPGLEHRLPDIYGRLETLLDYRPDAGITFEPLAEDRAEAFAEQVRDAHASRLKFDRDGARPLPPERLYVDDAERAASLAGRAVLRFVEPEDEAEPDVPAFALAARPAEALRAFVRARHDEGRRVLLAGATAADLETMARRAVPGEPPVVVETWDEVQAAPPGSLRAMLLPVDRGFKADPDVTVIAAADILGSRAGSALAAAAATSARLGDDEEAFRIGDAVIHLDHGVGVLAGIETIEAGPSGTADTIRLEYAGEAKLMVPTHDIELMWRYGPMRDGVTLDRLGSESWPKKRAKVEAEIGEAAAALARLAGEKHARQVPKIVPPRRAFERFVARFAFSETADQHAAISDILADLASGRPMDRLVCGDVGFGKTEVALRAAAALALAGRQVAVAVPTTVLVRQHMQTFERRFAGLGIAIRQLSRLVGPAEAREVKEGLATGEIRIVIGTHALAAKGIRFADLGLLVVDEEQRFGAADKEKLKRLGDGVHVLTMTATPIPRTMQAALAGLQDVSVLATPPSERQPVRTFVAPLDDATMREALLRERRRGGQSFVVCPRIEDIGPMADRLRRLAPELDTLVAHGKLKADEIDATMVSFAGGAGDVLLATNIIESGLDVPRANTIFVWRADRFGLGQLHQLRGRVGRGRQRGIAYLLTDPEGAVAPATQARLERLAALDRLGAGFEVSADDLDSRGAGDLLGDTQAGHVKLIGAGLYRRLLERALLVARGLVPADEWTPELNIGASGLIPSGYVPEPEVRLNLYARIARTRDERAEDHLAEEIADRFGPLPPSVADLLALARLRRLCRAAGIARVDAGPQAVALTFKEGRPSEERLGPLLAAHGNALAWKEARLILARPSEDGERAALAEGLVRGLVPG